jgi:hypothetical protein
MRYYIGIHVESFRRKTVAVAIAAEAHDEIPDRYVDREPWEIRRLLPAQAQVTHIDPHIAARAALQRLYERLFIRNFIPNPKTCVPPATIYVTPKLETEKIPGRVKQVLEHWTIDVAAKVKR